MEKLKKQIKIKNFLIRFWPVIFIFFLWFIFSSPYFLKSKVPFPSTYQVNHFHPWSAFEKFWGPVKNGAMPDIVDQIYPWRHFTIETWKRGQIPFWNPYSFSGNPHLANYQSAVFSPFNLLFFILPFVDAWSLMVLLQPLLAAFFTYFLLREFKLSKEGSLLGSITFMFCGFIVVWMAYGTLAMAIAFLPLALLVIKRSFNNPGLFPLILLALSIPFSFFSGHFQTSLYFLMFVFAFLIFESVKSRDRKKILNAWLAFFTGISISLIQIIPSVQLYFNSPRSEAFIKGGGIPLNYLITIFAPDFFGNPVTLNDWFGPYAEWASFIGIIPLLLVVFAFLNKRNAYLIFFFFSGIISLLMAIDSPFQSSIGSLKLPVFSTSDPNRIIVLFSFSLAVLSGLGLDSLKNLILKKSVKKIFITLLIFGIILTAIWSLIFVFKIMPVDKIAIAKRNFILPTVLFFGSAIFILSSLFNKRIILFAIFFLLAVVSFDSLRFAQKWMPFDPKDKVFPEVPVISGIRKNIGYGRIFGNIRAQVDTYYEFPGIEGYDPLYIERYGEFIQASELGEYAKALRSVVQLGRDNKIDRVLDLLGVSLIFNPVADTNQSWAYPVWANEKKYKLVYQDSKYQLYRNNTVLKRASLFYDYEVIEDKNEILKTFYSKNFNFREKLILEEDPKLSKETGKNGSAEIISYAPNKVIIKINTDSPALLFLSDNFYSGWKAKVNGVDSKIYRADYAFRAVKISKGNSTVEFDYSFF